MAQQQLTHGHFEGGQRNGNAGNQHQIEDIRADDIADTQGSMALSQRRAGLPAQSHSFQT